MIKDFLSDFVFRGLLLLYLFMSLSILLVASKIIEDMTRSHLYILLLGLFLATIIVFIGRDLSRLIFRYAPSKFKVSFIYIFYVSTLGRIFQKVAITALILFYVVAIMFFANVSYILGLSIERLNDALVVALLWLMFTIFVPHSLIESLEQRVISYGVPEIMLYFLLILNKKAREFDTYNIEIKRIFTSELGYCLEVLSLLFQEYISNITYGETKDVDLRKLFKRVALLYIYDKDSRNKLGNIMLDIVRLSIRTNNPNIIRALNILADIAQEKELSIEIDKLNTRFKNDKHIANKAPIDMIKDILKFVISTFFTALILFIEPTLTSIFLIALSGGEQIIIYSILASTNILVVAYIYMMIAQLFIYY